VLLASESVGNRDRDVVFANCGISARAACCVRRRTPHESRAVG
jgi:hypothetical protein